LRYQLFAIGIVKFLLLGGLQTAYENSIPIITATSHWGAKTTQEKSAASPAIITQIIARKADGVTEKMRIQYNIEFSKQ